MSHSLPRILRSSGGSSHNCHFMTNTVTGELTWAPVSLESNYGNKCFCYVKPQGDRDASLDSALLTEAHIQLINPQNIPQLDTLDCKGQKTSKVS